MKLGVFHQKMLFLKIRFLKRLTLFLKKLTPILKRLNAFLKRLTLLLKNNPRLDTLHQKNRTKKRFFLLNPKYFTIFAPVISPRLGIMSFGWGGCRHNKASLRACVWLSGISQILTTSNTLQHFDVLGICISISIRTMRVCICAYISAWASVLFVRMLRQYQSLK